MNPISLEEIHSKIKTIAFERGPLGILFLPFDFLLQKTLCFFFTRKKLLRFQAVDVYLRYSFIAQQLSADEKNILEVGGANTALHEFLTHNYSLTIIDKDTHYKAPTNISYILNSNSNIPFPDNAFDCIISTAMLEHIPRDQRQEFIDEWKRVGKRILLYVPFGTHGRKYDLLLWRLKKCFGMHDKWTEEHIMYGIPTLVELKEYFPTAKITFIQNGNIWLITTFLSSFPIIGRIAPGILYTLLKHYDTKEPRIGACISWEKN